MKLDGVNYGIPPDSIEQGEDDGKALLLHDPKTQKYYSTPAGSIQSYHVQEMITLPGDNGTGSLEAQDYEKPPRKQVKNLKMRFRPVGSGNGPPETIGSSSEESDGEEKGKSTFKFPKDATTAAQEKEERKRKHRQTEGDGNQANGASRKKSKKHSSTQEGGIRWMLMKRKNLLKSRVRARTRRSEKRLRTLLKCA